MCVCVAELLSRNTIPIGIIDSIFCSKYPTVVLFSSTSVNIHLEDYITIDFQLKQ